MGDLMTQVTTTKKLLLIDDDEMSRWLVQLCLECFVDWQINVAISGKQGLRAIAKAEPDAVLLDIMMPDMDGFTFMKKLRVDKPLAYIPIIALTASTNKFSHQSFINLGCQGVINKPFNTNTLGSQISQILGW
ncbi:MAG: two-component system response regulator [Pseudanabaena sp.]|nr:MAG: two-component system response regulator [Pseudanabaena sp.]